MKKNMSLVLLLIFSFYSSLVPMQQIVIAPDHAPGITHQHDNEFDYEFSELTPATSASIAIIAFFEGADKGVDEKIDLIFQKGCSLFWKGCVKLTAWFMKD